MARPVIVRLGQWLPWVPYAFYAYGQSASNYAGAHDYVYGKWGLNDYGYLIAGQTRLAGWWGCLRGAIGPDCTNPTPPIATATLVMTPLEIKQVGAGFTLELGRSVGNRGLTDQAYFMAALSADLEVSLGTSAYLAGMVGTELRYSLDASWLQSNWGRAPMYYFRTDRDRLGTEPGAGGWETARFAPDAFIEIVLA
jgi:hypothetical protein